MSQIISKIHLSVRLQGGASQMRDFGKETIKHFINPKDGWKGTDFSSPQKQKIWKKLPVEEKINAHCRAIAHDLQSDQFKVTIN